MSLLELGANLHSTTALAVGTASDWPGRVALAARLGCEVPELILYDNLDATVARAAELIEQPLGQTVRISRVISDPQAIAYILGDTIQQIDPRKNLAQQLNEVVAEAAAAAALHVDPLLLTRLYVAVDRLRLDAADPLGWAEIHDLATALQSK